MEENILEYKYENASQMRLDKFLSEQISDISRSYIQKLCDDGKVVIVDVSGNEKSLKPSYKLKTGDIIRLTIPEPEKLEIVAENIPLNIVYEDEHVIVIDKPQGMVVHPAAGNYTGTLVNALMYHCGDSLSSINGVERPGIVHRIDKDTSGLLVVCKSNIAHQGLAEQFEKHSINRIYSCIVYNHFDIEKMEKTEPGLYTIRIDKAINRSKNDRKKWLLIHQEESSNKCVSNKKYE